MDFDLLVIGTGAAGVAAAIQAAPTGGTIAIAESGTLGGTCVNIGCIPSKNLIEAAAHYRAAQRGFAGVEGCNPGLSWTELMRGKDDLVARMRQERYADVLASYPGIKLLHGRVRLTGGGNGAPVEIAITDRESTRACTARKLIIATGTRPAAPPISGADSVGALDSTTAMEMQVLPASMLVIGGSATGLELGQTFCRLGTEVTIIEIAPRLLPMEDESVSEELEDLLRADGMQIHTGVTATSVRQQGAKVLLHADVGKTQTTFEAERILFATGRRPNTDDLGLETVGVSLYKGGFVQVDSRMRTSNQDIFAAGDVTGGPGYVYVAAAGGRIAAENAISAISSPGSPHDSFRELDLSVVPNVTFTSPQVASVGLTTQMARELGRDVRIATFPISQLPRALVRGDARGFVKMIADAGTGVLIGVHAIAPFAGELMGEATLAIRFGLTPGDLSGILHPYLTWGEAMKLAAQAFTTDVSRLSCCA